MKKQLFLILLPIVLVVFLITKWEIVSPKEDLKVDLDSIVSRGKIVVAINSNNTDYFIYRGEPKGFQFELMQELGNSLGVKVEIIVNQDVSENLRMLQNGECDLVASSWNYSVSDKNEITHSKPLLETQMVLVQRKPSDLIVSTENKPDILVSSLNELEGKSVYVPLLSGEAFSIKQLDFYKKGKLKVYEIPEQTQEKLIQSVALGEIDYTLCNSIIAKSLIHLYPELNFETIVKTSEPIVWNLRKNTPELIEYINNWISNYFLNGRFGLLTDKYFNNRNAWFPADRAFNPVSSGKLSAYDMLIKKHSSYINWDWRLLAALIYQESRFKPNVKSRRGAYGLMQMMPSTGNYFGLDTSATPEQQIIAGVKYIKFLDKAFADKIEDPRERVNFILASYNIGPGHIFDAQILAEKSGKDPQKWFNSVDSCLLSKSEHKYYSDPDIQHGYCKGTETYNFVQEILNRYHHFKNIIQ